MERPTPLIYKINKPKGVSSFSVIASLKNQFPKSKSLKMGHFGTLDPFADGLLLVGINGATRLNQYIQKAYPKTYLARGLFGVKTTTGDLEGDIIQESPAHSLKSLSLVDLKVFFQDKFRGEYLQSPPSFSAAKFKGKRLYKYALEGTNILKEPKVRHIHNIDILSFDYPHITFSATVSSGTYIRALFEDMAFELGSIGHLVELKRTAIGSLDLMDSLSPHDLSDQKEKGLTLDKVFPLSNILLSDLDALKFCQGNNIDLSFSHGSSPGENLWVYNKNNLLLGMGKIKEGRIFPVWVLA